MIVTVLRYINITIGIYVAHTIMIYNIVSQHFISIAYSRILSSHSSFRIIDIFLSFTAIVGVLHPHEVVDVEESMRVGPTLLSLSIPLSIKKLFSPSVEIPSCPVHSHKPVLRFS